MPIPTSARLAALGKFLLSAGLTLAVIIIVAPLLAGLLGGSRRMLFDIVYRFTWAAILLSLYSLLEVAMDNVEGDPIAAQGFPRGGWLPQLAIGAGLGMVMVAIAVAAIATFGEIQRVTFSSSAHSMRWAAAALIVLILGALAEELAFRGYPFQKLVEAIGPIWAIVAFSALFGFAHMLNPNVTVWGVLNTVGVGALFAVAYLRTRALWLPWGLHFGWNFTLGMVCGLPVSGLKTFSAMVRTTVAGPLWLTGGAYGIEGSATGAAVIGLGLLAMWRLPVSRRYKEKTSGK